MVSFQVLYQTKLMLTAVLSVLFLGKRLGRRQWLALVTLTVGVVAVELSDASLKAAPPPPPPAALGRSLSALSGGAAAGYAPAAESHKQLVAAEHAAAGLGLSQGPRRVQGGQDGVALPRLTDESPVHHHAHHKGPGGKPFGVRPHAAHGGGHATRQERGAVRVVQRRKRQWPQATERRQTQTPKGE